MADKTDDLVIGVSTDLSSMQRAIKKLDGDLSRAGSQIERKFAAIGRSIDKSMPTGIQDRINKMVGAQTAATKEWSGALAEQGKEMEKLRARFNPMYSTITRYKSAVNEIRAAHRLGAISADEMTAAIQRERQAALAATAAIKGRNAAVATATRPGSFNTANIAAQFQDIGVTTAMGMNPMTIALQQGTQLSAVLESMKGQGQSTGQALAAAFSSIISPLSLVTIGVIAAGTAIAQYALSGGKEVEKFDELLKRHEEVIKSLGPAYKDALVSAREYSADTAVASALRNQNERELVQRIAQETAAAAKAIDAAVKSSVQTALGTTAAQTLQEAEAESMFRPFLEAIERLKSGAIDARAFRDEIVQIADTAPGLTEAASQLKGMIQPVVDMMPALDDAKREIDAVAVAANKLANEISLISSAKAQKELTDLMEQAKAGEISIKDLLAELARISGYAPDVSGIISAFKAVAEAAIAARDAQVGWTAKESKGGRSRYSTAGSVFLPGSAPAPTSRPLIEFEKPPATRAPKRTADDRFFEDIEAVKQRTIALAEERAMLGLTFEAQQKRKTAFELEQKALKDAREAARQKGEQDWQNAELTPEQIQKIDEVSSAYARQAEELRSAREQSQFWSDALYGVFTDLVPAVETGNKALDNFLNKLIEVGLQAALLGKGPFGGGGGGLIGGLLRGIGLPGFAQGTLNAPGGWAVVGEKGPELVNLPRGAKVTPNYQLRAPQAPRLSSGASASSTTYAPVYQIDARGADQAAIARLEAGLKERDRKFGSMVDKRVDTRQFRKTRG